MFQKTCWNTESSASCAIIVQRPGRIVDAAQQHRQHRHGVEHQHVDQQRRHQQHRHACFQGSLTAAGAGWRLAEPTASQTRIVSATDQAISACSPTARRRIAALDGSFSTIAVPSGACSM